jgi:hypothetical protein
VTYYGRAASEHVDLHLALRVEGIPYAFVTRTIPGSPSALSGYTQVVCMTGVTEGEAVLDLVERREMAATLDVEMLDTDADLFRTLFASASRPVTWIQTAFTSGDTDLEVTDAAAVSSGDVVYIGDETIVVGTVSGANDWLGCTRGAFGSTARALFGDTSTGDNAYTTPPHWRGRRARLYGYAPDGAGTYTETLLGVYLVDESPRHTGGKAWSLRLAGIVQEYWERVCGLGIEAATFTGTGTWDFTGASPVIEHPVTDASKFRLSQTVDSYVIAQTEFGSGIHKLTAIDLAGSITLAYEPSFQTTRAMQATSSVGDVRQIAVVQLPGAASILSVLLSDEGQALSGGDYLPGRPPSESSDLGWRFGAAFASSEVDSTAFDAITAVPPMTMIIDGERKVTDILREWCFLTGTAVVTTVDGKIKPVPIGATRSTNATNIGAADIIPEGPIEVIHDEGTVFPILKAQAGYSPITGEFHDEVNLVDADLAKRYRRAPQVFDIELRSIDVWEPPNSGPARQSSGWRHPTRQRASAIITMLADLMRSAGGARRLVRLSLSHEHLSLRLGDVVTLGTDLPEAFDELPDMRGSTLRGATCRVVARRPRYDQARVDVQLEVMDRLLHVCPAAVITSAAGAVLTIDTTTPEVPASGFPSNGFYVGAAVKVFDRSSLSGVAVVDSLTVTAIPATNQITLSGAPSFAVQSGVDYVVLDPENSADGTNGDGYQLIEMAKLADVDGTAGVNASTDNEPRWR